MAVGQKVKSEVYNQIQQMFPGSFMYNGGKELRINTKEDGVDVQLKLVLTAAKTPVSNGEDTLLPGEKIDTPVVTAAPVEKKVAEITPEEHAKVQSLADMLGLL